MSTTTKLSGTFAAHVEPAPAPVLDVPDDLKQSRMLDRFYKNSRTIAYSDRLHAAGFHLIGDLNGKTEAQIRRQARTTDKNWELFKWALGTYGAHFK